MIKKIALCGKKGSGKSTLAYELAIEYEKRGVKMETMAFADPIKTLAQMVFGFDGPLLWSGSHLREIFPIEWERWPKVMWENAISNMRSNEVEDYLISLGFPYNDFRRVVENLMTQCVDFQATPMPPYYIYTWKKPLTPRLALQLIGEAGRDVYEDIWTSNLIRKARSVDGVIVTDVRYPNELDLLVENGFLPVYVEGGTSKDDHVSESFQEELRDQCIWRFDNSDQDRDILRNWAEVFVKGAVGDYPLTACYISDAEMQKIRENQDLIKAEDPEIWAKRLADDFFKENPDPLEEWREFHKKQG